jgi:protein-S-isoprenylcysteine O-methyltransferase Ste14
MTAIFIAALTIGIIAIKTIWIRTEIHFSRERVNAQMFKTNAIEALIIILQILASIYTPIPKTPFNSAIIFTSIVAYIIGSILALWGRNTMSKSWGIPGVHSAKQNKLVTTGPFAFSRNPIYLGFLLLYFGYAAAILSWLIILRIPLAIYFYKSAKKEEINLEKKFGKEYVEYKSRVPLFI